MRFHERMATSFKNKRLVWNAEVFQPLSHNVEVFKGHYIIVTTLPNERVRVIVVHLKVDRKLIKSFKTAIINKGSRETVTWLIRRCA